jgi:hypothetical protein
MSNSLRRIYNSIDSLFDRRAISQELRISKDDTESTYPKTAMQAFEKVQTFAYELDRQARLKWIVSQQGVNSNGESSHWEFSFDLTERRAHLVCDWLLLFNETIDKYLPAKIELTLKPFPPADSPLRQMVKDGQLLHRQLIGMWKQEIKRTPDLPHKFRDTSLIVEELSQQGLDIAQTEFSLSTGQDSSGKLCWLAQTRQKKYYDKFL